MKNVIRLIGLLFVSIIFTQCKKDGTGDQGSIELKLLNVSPNSTPLTFKVNDQAASTPALGYLDTTSYLPFGAGTYNVSIGMGSVVPINTIIDFAPGRAYSLLAVDSAHELKLSVVQDDLTLPLLPLRAKIRYFNLSPNSSSLSLRLTNASADTIRFSSRGFNSQTTSQALANFQAIPSDIYDIALVTDTIIAKLPAQQLLANKIYTVYARGFKGGTGNLALGLGIVVNK